MATLRSVIGQMSLEPLGSTIRASLENLKPTGGGDGKGKIELEPNVWQNIAIPVSSKNIKDYVMDWLATVIIDTTGTRPAEDWCEIAKAFPSNASYSGETLAYIPGTTPDGDKGNFNLMMTDGADEEIVSFFIKMKDYTTFHAATIIFPWNMDGTHDE